jgi:DNA-binding response OmpR family regulator
MSQVRVLVVEDDVVLGKLLTEALISSGFSADYAIDGEKGLAAFLLGRHHVVVTDIIMPEREGLETLHAIKKVAPEVKIIAMSGGGRIGATAFLALARRMGADVTLAKPFRPSELIAAIRALEIALPGSE